MDQHLQPNGHMTVCASIMTAIECDDGQLPNSPCNCNLSSLAVPQYKIQVLISVHDTEVYCFHLDNVRFYFKLLSLWDHTMTVCLFLCCLGNHNTDNDQPPRCSIKAVLLPRI